MSSAVGAEPGPPRIDAQDQRYVTQMVRRALAARLAADVDYAPSYRPAALEAVTCPAVVTLRVAGVARGRGVSRAWPVLDAAIEGARVAFQSARQSGAFDADSLERALIEIEAIGEAAPVEWPRDWSEGDRAETAIEPGVHGMVLENAGDRRQLLPSEVFTTDNSVRDALIGLGEQVGLAGDKLDQGRLSRFRTTHWVELRPGGEVVQLQRGLIVIPLNRVTAQAIDAAVQRIAEYMLYRQRPDGSFSYQYEPNRDAYSDEDNPVRQAGAAWAMACYARREKSSAALAAADLALKPLLDQLTDLTDVEGASFIRTPSSDNELGVTALTCLALLDHPQPALHARERDKLLTGMLWVQLDSGQFVTAFPPARRVSSQVYFPGETLCALARAYALDPQERHMRAFDKALDYYRDYFERERIAAFVPWQVQAFAEMAAHSKRDDFAAFVFRMCDWLADSQLDERNCPWPEMWGGIAPYTPGRAGIATASYLEGLVDALKLARKRDDRARAERYERVITAAARFVMQLEVRPEEAYWMRSPQDAVGGIRASPSLSRLRIDHCQHALLALSKAREVLFAE